MNFVALMRASQVESRNYSIPPILKQVRHLVEAGFAIHRLHPRSKAPIGDGWGDRPVLSFEKLQRAYRAGENVGVRLGEPSRVAGGYLHVFDMDIRDPAKAAEARATLAKMLPEWASLPSVISGSGGDSRHLYAITDKPFRSKKLAHSAEKIEGKDGKKHWAWEIELFGTGKQVVVPPSIHPDTGQPYRWERPFDFIMLDLGDGPFIRSERIERLVGEESKPEGTDDERAAPLGLSDDEIADTLAALPQAQYCDDRDGWLTVGMALHHETGGSKKGFELWCAFSERSDKFDKGDQKRVWKSFKGKHKPVRMATLVNAAREARLEDEFENLDDSDLLEPAEDDAFADLLGPSTVSPRQQKLNKAKVEADLGHVPAKVQRINRKHAVAFINGKTVILTETRDGSVSYGTVGDLHNYYENDRVATDKSTVPVTKWWIQHKKRREYPNGVVFSPGEEVEGAYNHWRGFAVEPDSSGSCRLILDHIHKVLCNGDEVAARYLIGWLAHLIQRPWEKPGVAIVLRGAKGAGKDTLGDYVGALFPHHHVKIANQEHMVGRFNQHQERCLLLHVEEAFWAGNRQAESHLKHLITSEKVLIEPKGVNPFTVKSVLRLFISSNEKWVVPASDDERRYFVSDVSPKWSRKNSPGSQRKRYFDALRHERDNGGLAALLHFLMTYDLSAFDVRDVPDTAALGEQKVATLRDVEAWWFEMLEAGEMGDVAVADALDEPGHLGWERGAVQVRRDELRAEYDRWQRRHIYKASPVGAVTFGRQLRRMCPKLRDLHLGSLGARYWAYQIPALSVCRSDMLVHLNLPDDFFLDERRMLAPEG